MFKFTALALVGVVSAIENIDSLQFMNYVAKYGKNYDNIEEWNMRFGLWSHRNQLINEWNQDSSHTHRLGHNQISDFTKQELAKLSGLNTQKPTHTNATTFVPGKLSLPLSVNWVDAGKVGAIKDQGQCGSCWAFSATAAVESSIAIDNGTTPGNYSEQQLVSCSSAYGNLGCSGGWYFWAWDYTEVNAQENGVDYPYTSGSTGLTGNCYADTSKGVALVTNYVQVGTTNEEIKAAIVNKPVSVAIEADTYLFQSYSSGVITSSACGTYLDHAVVAVGYGEDSVAGPYFLVRNSWGTWWGDQGYVKIGQSPTGTAPGVCGINSYVFYPNTRTV